MTQTGFAAEQLLSLATSGNLAHNGQKCDGIPTHGEWAIEPKFDGWCLFAHVRDGKVGFYSRTGKPYSGKLPLVEAELLEHFPAGTWLAGEAVAIRATADGSVVNEWSDAQTALTTHGATAAAGRITYMVFDLIAHRGIDARPLPYAKRRKLLEKAFEGKALKRVALTPSFPATPGRHEHLVSVGFEGSMLKQTTASYASGKRGHGILKWKVTVTEDVVVMGFKPGENSFEGMVGAVVFGQYKDGVLVERGRCSGMDMRTRQDMTKHPEKWLGAVIEVRHMGQMKDGWRHPQMRRRRDDKEALQCDWT